MSNDKIIFGRGNATFQALGGEQGIQALVDKFYEIMGNTEAYKTIYNMHPDDIQISRDKLFHFLCVWCGGPKTFLDRFGQVNIPKAHSHLPITSNERDQWLYCMRDALVALDYEKKLINYMLHQLSKPAELIRKVAANNSPQAID